MTQGTKSPIEDYRIVYTIHDARIDPAILVVTLQLPHHK
jgi:hypothetical protein